jgi:CS1-pili formation C-terminal
LKHARDVAIAVGMALSCAFCAAQPQTSRTVHVSGYVQDVNGLPVAGASVAAHGARTVSDSSGHYVLSSPPGLTTLEVAVGQNTSFCLAMDLEEDRELNIRLKIGSTVTVHAEQDALTPDPSTQGYTPDELLAANPGRPGVPVSVPGYPVETASGGLRRRSTSRQASPVITANLSHSFFR